MNAVAVAGQGPAVKATPVGGLTARRPKVDGRSRRAAEKRARTRQQILDSAKRVFATRGYQRTTVADLIDGAGVARGTFYLHFDGKDVVFRELLGGFVDRLMGAVEVVDPTSKDATDQLLDTIRRVVDILFDSRYLTVVLLREAVGLSPEVDATLARLHAFWLEMVSGALDNGATWGLTRKVHSQIVATAIVGAIKEILYQHLVAEDRADHAETPEQVAVALFDFCLNGLLPR